LSASSYSSVCNVSSACSYNCAATECIDEERSKCEKQGFAATFPKTSDRGIQTACRKNFERADRCKLKTDNPLPICDQYAKQERTEMVPFYECSAALPCDATKEQYEKCAPSPSDFGTQVARKAVGRGITIATKEADAMNAHGAWLRDDVKDAALKCFDYEGVKANECFKAWKAAIPR
jgi:hypothetical protein